MNLKISVKMKMIVQKMIVAIVIMTMMMMIIVHVKKFCVLIMQETLKISYYFKQRQLK